MTLTIILTKQVDDQTEAQTLTQLVKDRLEDHPDVTISAEVHDKVEESS